MTELEELRAQKMALEEKIRALKVEGSVLGDHGIKLAKLQKSGNYDRPWYVGVRGRDEYGNYEQFGTYLRVIVAKSREKVISMLPQLIEDLQDFYAQLQDETEAEKSQYKMEGR